MSTSAVAGNYAETLLELAVREGEEDRYGELLATVAALVGDVPEFRIFLDTPRIPSVEKKRVLREVLSGRVPGLFLNFLLVVFDKGRQHWLPAIEAAYRDLLDRKEGRIHATVRLPFAPDEALRDELTRSLSERLGGEVVPHFLEEERLLGGVVIRVGDRVMDGSLRRRLEDLRSTLVRTDGSGSTL